MASTSTCAPGEVHVLFGENGAGKSTLINIIAGTFSPDSGTFRFNGEVLRGLTPHKARVIGISPVFQEFSLVAEMTVEENLFLGREIATAGILSRTAMHQRAAKIIADLGFAIEPGSKVASLSRAHQQMTEIAKALMGTVRVLILDEPTASLTESETVRLFELVDELKASGIGIIYVSHRMGEIKQLGRPHHRAARRPLDPHARCRGGQRERAGRADDRPQDRAAVSRDRASTGRDPAARSMT